MENKIKKYACVVVPEPFAIHAFCSAHDLIFKDDFVFSGEKHDFWEIVCVLSGEVEVVEDGRVYTLSEGNMVAHAPMEFHRIRSAGGSRPHVAITSFLHTGAPPTNLADGVFHLSGDECREYYEIVTRLMPYIANGTGNPDALSEIALSYAAFLFRAVTVHKPHKMLSHDSRAEKYGEVVRVMQETLSENLSLSDIAARCAISVSTVKALFRTYAAIGAKAYYSRLRGEEASRLLYEGKSVSEVSDLLGFSSPNYFSLFYKKQYGNPPARSKKGGDV